MSWLVTAAWVTAGIAAAGATVSYVQQQKAADAQEEAGKMQNKAAEQNARNQELQNAENIKRQRVNNRRQRARMHTAMAGTSGLVFDGSLEDAFVETSGQMELQIQDAARAGALDAANARSAGATALWEARAGAIGTRMKATGTLISTAASAAGTYAGTA